MFVKSHIFSFDVQPVTSALGFLHVPSDLPALFLVWQARPFSLLAHKGEEKRVYVACQTSIVLCVPHRARDMEGKHEEFWNQGDFGYVKKEVDSMMTLCKPRTKVCVL